MRVLLFALIPLSAACSTKVYNPALTAAQQEADIALCSDQANRRFWMDPIAALYNAYDCLEAKGYRREQPALAAQLEQALGGGSRPKPAAPAAPCKVPCRTGT
jgi:hypothetical protein